MVGKNPIVLVGTKLDLLPEGTHPRDVAGMLDSMVGRAPLPSSKPAFLGCSHSPAGGMDCRVADRGRQPQAPQRSELPPSQQPQRRGSVAGNWQDLPGAQGEGCLCHWSGKCECCGQFPVKQKHRLPNIHKLVLKSEYSLKTTLPGRQVRICPCYAP